MTQSQNPKVILITGCSSGFGLLIAARLASQGNRVFATMRDLAKKQPLLDEAKKRNATVAVLQLDVTDAASIKKAIHEITNSAGRIDVLVNNAGSATQGFFEDLSEGDIRNQMEVNFFGVQNVTREVIPLMRAQKSGKIINISSISGLYALPALGAYNASKWALEGFSESLYYELKIFGIDVCLIEPGSYKTKIFFENTLSGKDFNNPKSVYYKYSQSLRMNVSKRVQTDKKNPEDIAILVEKLIDAARPPFRSIPDGFARLLYFLRRFLPFRLFSYLLYRVVLAGVK